MTMYEKFSQLLSAQNVTPYRIHKETGISTATLSDWKNGKSEPKRDKIQKICDFFNVPISYFYEEIFFYNSLRNLETRHPMFQMQPEYLLQHFQIGKKEKALLKLKSYKKLQTFLA